MRRENASLLGVVVCLFAAVFNGFGPQLKQASDWVCITTTTLPSVQTGTRQSAVINSRSGVNIKRDNITIM